MATRAAEAPSSRAGTRVAAVPSGYPASSVRFDWMMGVLAALLSAGIVQDGWAHAHGEVDQSFLTPWHAILYGSMELSGFVLGGFALRNRRLGYSVARALPFGYWFALAGVFLFAAAGVFDLFWHTLFGIENGVDALLSPSHLLLALGAALVFSGVLRSIAHQYGRAAGGWRRIGPAVLALGAALILFGFFTAYAQPIEDGFTATTIGRDPAGPLVAQLYESDPNGGAARKLSLPPGLDVWGIAVAPDGKHIAYRAQAPHSGSSSATEPSDLYVAKADGSQARRITHSGRHDTQLAWSPDSASLAYISLPAGASGDFELRVVRADGSGARTLVAGTTTLGAPAWSPDGRIAYASRRGLDAMLAIVPARGGAAQWLENTKGGSAPAWSGDSLLFTTDDGALHSAQPGGGPAGTLVKKDVSEPSLSFDGRHLVYLGNAAGAVQAIVADADGTHPRNVSQLAGADAAHPAWAPDGHILYTVNPRPAPERSQTGYSLAEAANLLQAVMLAGVLLLVVRRWRAPLGTFTLLLPLFALAMAAQSDAYYDAIPALVTGLVADVALAFGGERLRTGLGFYAFAFCLPALFFALYLVATVQSAGGSAWTADMLLGSPLLAGCAGLLVGFSYRPPLPEAVDA